MRIPYRRTLVLCSSKILAPAACRPTQLCGLGEITLQPCIKIKSSQAHFVRFPLAITIISGWYNKKGNIVVNTQIPNPMKLLFNTLLQVNGDQSACRVYEIEDSRFYVEVEPTVERLAVSSNFVIYSIDGLWVTYHPKFIDVAQVLGAEIKSLYAA